mgnify:CR=1 FL=1
MFSRLNGTILNKFKIITVQGRNWKRVLVYVIVIAPFLPTVLHYHVYMYNTINDSLTQILVLFLATMTD